MCTSIMNENQIAKFNLRQHSIHSKFIAVFAQATGYVIFMVAGLVFLAHNGDMMICTINSRTHQVSSASIAADVFFIGVLFVNSSSYEAAVGSQHEAAQLGENLHIAHTCRHQNFFINLAHTFANYQQIIILLLGAISNADATGQVDELDMGAGLFLQLYSNLEEDASQLRIIIIGHSVGGQESMHTEMLNTLSQKALVGLDNLLMSHAIFSIAGVIHDVVGDGEMSARVVAAAYSIRNIGHLFQKVDMSDIVQINGDIQLARQLEVLRRGSIGGEHNLAFLEAHSVAHQQLGIGGAVSAAALLAQDLQQIGVGSCFNCEIFLEALIPRESLVQQTCSTTNASLIIQMEGSGILSNNLFQLIFSYKGYFLRHVYHLSVNLIKAISFFNASLNKSTRLRLQEYKQLESSASSKSPVKTVRESAIRRICSLCLVVP